MDGGETITETTTTTSSRETSGSLGSKEISGVGGLPNGREENDQQLALRSDLLYLIDLLIMNHAFLSKGTFQKRFSGF